jgi:hypothetical protein
VIACLKRARCRRSRDERGGYESRAGHGGRGLDQAAAEVVFKCAADMWARISAAVVDFTKGDRGDSHRPTANPRQAGRIVASSESAICRPQRILCCCRRYLRPSIGRCCRCCSEVAGRTRPHGRETASLDRRPQSDWAHDERAMSRRKPMRPDNPLVRQTRPAYRAFAGSAEEGEAGPAATRVRRRRKTMSTNEGAAGVGARW